MPLKKLVFLASSLGSFEATELQLNCVCVKYS